MDIVILNQTIKSQFKLLLEGQSDIQGHILGWSDTTNRTIRLYRLLPALETQDKAMCLTSFGLEIVAQFVASSRPEFNFIPKEGFNTQSDIILVAGYLDGDITIKILDSQGFEISANSFEPESDMNEHMQNNLVMIYTGVTPSLIYFHEKFGTTALESVLFAANKWSQSNLSIDRTTFLAKSSHGSQVITVNRPNQLSIATLCRMLLPSESSSSRRKKTANSGIQCLEFELFHNHSPSLDPLEAIAVRYVAIQHAEKSLDDSTRDDFELNPAAFHALYPHLSVVTYAFKYDHTENGLQLALSRHLESLRSQLFSIVSMTDFWSQAVDPFGTNASSMVYPFHFHLPTSLSHQDVITLLYPQPNIPDELVLEYSSVLLIPPDEQETISDVNTSISFPSSSQDSNRPGSLNASLTMSTSSRRSTVDSSSSSDILTRISNIHEHVPSLGDSWNIHIVKGSYDYYHYGQGSTNDKGWGCAYRSMQTITSWIVKQHLSIRPVPSHLEIQRMLVELLDKPPSFVNSKQWIGAVEISMCLSQYWDVMCKILHAQNGSKIIDYTQDLVQHFDTLGCPVMVGGSVLAYTILGIATAKTPSRNPSNDVKFLILDPHYVGQDNISTIISKGWCAWNSMSLWKEDAFYNFCLPQTPIYEK